MVTVLGCDPHLDTFDAAVIDRNGCRVAERHLTNAKAGWCAAAGMVHQFGATLVGIEAASGYGRGLATHLAAAGIEVVEIPTRLTGVWRSRDGRHKTDAGDAEAIAQAAAAGRGHRWRHTPDWEALRVLVHYRQALLRTQNRETNQLRALLIEIDPARAARLPRLRSLRIFTELGRVRYGGDAHRDTVAGLIRDIARDSRRRLIRIRTLQTRIEATLPAAGWDLIAAIEGMGTLSAAELLAELAGTDGFSSEARLASWAGVAPLEASSGRQQRHRLNRGGNRQANAALYRVIITQLRHGGEAATYINRRRQEGKTTNEAIRAAKRHLIRRIWKILHQHQLT